MLKYTSSIFTHSCTHCDQGWTDCIFVMPGGLPSLGLVWAIFWATLRHFLGHCWQLFSSFGHFWTDFGLFWGWSEPNGGWSEPNGRAYFLSQSSPGCDVTTLGIQLTFSPEWSQCGQEESHHLQLCKIIVFQPNIVLWLVVSCTSMSLCLCLDLKLCVELTRRGSGGRGSGGRSYREKSSEHLYYTLNFIFIEK